MISQEFKDRIKNFNKPLFYNSTGNKEAYKLFVRHLSFVPNMGLARKEGNFIVPKKTLYLVDFESEEIIEIKDKIELVELKYL